MRVCAFTRAPAQQPRASAWLATTCGVQRTACDMWHNMDAARSAPRTQCCPLHSACCMLHCMPHSRVRVPHGCTPQQARASRPVPARLRGGRGDLRRRVPVARRIGAADHHAVVRRSGGCEGSRANARDYAQCRMRTRAIRGTNIGIFRIRYELWNIQDKVRILEYSG